MEMKRTLLLFFLILAWWLPGARAQVQSPVQTFISGGVATGAVYPATTIPTFFGSVGQPMVYVRSNKFDNGGGVMVSADLMFGAGAADAVPPVITFTTQPTVSLTALTNITVTMTDDKAVITKRMFYRPILGGPFTQVDLTAGATQDTYTATIPVTDPMGVELYFKAFDTQNVTTSPDYYAYTSYPTPQVPTSLLKYGNTTADYRIISVPFDVTGNASAVFTDLIGPDSSKYRLWQYSNSNWTEYNNFQTIDRGKGYFIILDVNSVLLKLAAQKAPSNNRSHLFVMPLTSDWNLIGNPYPVEMDWASVLALNGNPASVGTLKTYGSSGYQNATTLQPYEGAFVKVTGSAPGNFQIGLDTQKVVGGRIADIVSSDLSSQEWEIPFILKQGDAQNKMSGIGMRPTASIGVDRYDDYSPPHVFDYVDMISQHPDLKVTDMTKDIVNTQGSYIWRFNATGGGTEEVELSWDNTKFGNNSIPLYLYDVGKDEVVNMREQGAIRFTPGQTRQFKIYYGINLQDITPDELVMNSPYPNPFAESTEIRFALPGVHDAYQVELEMLNSMGQRVRTIAKGTLNSGRYTYQWNGAGDDGDKVAAGLYFFKLAVDGKQSHNWTGRILYTH